MVRCADERDNSDFLTRGSRSLARLRVLIAPALLNFGPRRTTSRNAKVDSVSCVGSLRIRTTCQASLAAARRTPWSDSLPNEGDLWKYLGNSCGFIRQVGIRSSLITATRGLAVLQGK